MIFPFIELTQVYNDEMSEKYERPLWILPELIEYFTSFEVGYNGVVFTVKDDAKDIKRKLNAIFKKQKEEKDINGGEDDE